MACRWGLLVRCVVLRIPGLVIVLVAYWLLAFPLAVLGVRVGLGPAGPWLGLIVGLTVAAVLLNLRFWRLSDRRG